MKQRESAGERVLLIMRCMRLSAIPLPASTELAVGQESEWGRFERRTMGALRCKYSEAFMHASSGYSERRKGGCKRLRGSEGA
eukprot:1360166-Pleurochrysis_carterae.AAC.1